MNSVLYLAKLSKYEIKVDKKKKMSFFCLSNSNSKVIEVSFHHCSHSKSESDARPNFKCVELSFGLDFSDFGPNSMTSDRNCEKCQQISDHFGLLVSSEHRKRRTELQTQNMDKMESICGSLQPFYESSF